MDRILISGLSLTSIVAQTKPLVETPGDKPTPPHIAVRRENGACVNLGGGGER
ncbi:hypothetical protein PGTUg99_014277 [Puccinia graminis f. sp. tritici]|uniref:Uncharacterized protein n=1 Tax=Puccinia graminis f. sp. tritici TaxID=56615 RepID=A0A5B0R8N6_PUCGR|nr:hypothetical protein PGTUg99_014277 [Puccinia graminis f. sp. tritici]